MIIAKKQRTVGKITYDYVKYSKSHYVVMYDKYLNIIFITPKDDPIGANLETASISNGFGCDNWTEFQDEIKKRKLIYPKKI